MSNDDLIKKGTAIVRLITFLHDVLVTQEYTCYENWHVTIQIRFLKHLP